MAAAEGSEQNLVVLQLLPRLDVGGVERGVVELSAYLAQKPGATCIVASSGGQLVPQLAQSGTVHVERDCFRSKNPWNVFVRAPWELRRICQKHSVDVIHARSRVSSWSAWVLRSLDGRLRTVTTHHGAYGLHRGWWKCLAARAMVLADAVIFPSDFMADYVCAHQRLTRSGGALFLQETSKRALLASALGSWLGATCEAVCKALRILRAAVPWEATSAQERPLYLGGALVQGDESQSLYASASLPLKCEASGPKGAGAIGGGRGDGGRAFAVVPRGIDGAHFRFSEAACFSAQRLHADWGLSPGRPYVILPARISRIKGQKEFIAAMRLLAAAGGASGGEGGTCVAGGLMVGSMGRGRFCCEVTSDAAEISRVTGLGLRVLPECKDMASLLLCARVVCVPSLVDEAFCRVVIEALGMGRRVVAFGGGGISEIRRTLEERGPLRAAERLSLVDKGDVHGLCEALVRAHEAAALEGLWYAGDGSTESPPQELSCGSRDVAGFVARFWDSASTCAGEAAVYQRLGTLNSGSSTVRLCPGGLGDLWNTPPV